MAGTACCSAQCHGACAITRLGKHGRTAPGGYMHQSWPAPADIGGDAGRLRQPGNRLARRALLAVHARHAPCGSAARCRTAASRWPGHAGNSPGWTVRSLQRSLQDQATAARPAPRLTAQGGPVALHAAPPSASTPDTSSQWRFSPVMAAALPMHPAPRRGKWHLTAPASDSTDFKFCRYRYFNEQVSREKSHPTVHGCFGHVGHRWMRRWRRK